MHTTTTRQLIFLANACIHQKPKERPELLWLRGHHEQIQKQYHQKSKTDTDRLLYERMYKQAPQKQSELLKLRYWRTGRSTPGNREQCILYGKALELSENEMQILIQCYYDRSMEVYLSPKDCAIPDYLKKLSNMKQLTDTYLQKVTSDKLEKLNIYPGKISHYLRHLYFTDAFNYVHTRKISQEILVKHITSTRYDSEFTRQMKLLGEIPRKTMIRHLLILGLPEITLEQLNRQLQFYGYLPLTSEHTSLNGAYLDYLIIQLMEMYETLCSSYSPAEKTLWFQRACRILDKQFIQADTPELRFMHFKSLDL